MINTPDYRRCSKEDVPKMLEICRQSYIEHYTYLWTDHGENYMNKSFTQEKLLSELANKNSLFYLIYDEERAVGILKINLDKSPEGKKDTTCLEIERIYFLKQASGRGLGKLAIEW